MAMQVNSLVGRVIGGYRLERIIGNGSTGTVYLGRGVDQSVRAIKVLTHPGAQNPALEVEFRRRFNREEQVMRTLKHPNILFVEAFGEDTATNTVYMIMPYVDKGTLADRLDRGPLPFNLTIKYLRQLAAAVDFANERAIIHRDIKPGNVLIDAHDHIYLADFGIVKIYETRAGHPTTAGTLVGTPEYMAPEQAKGGHITRAADIYSVGMVAYHMLTGHMAFQSPNLTVLLLQIAQNAPPPPRTWRPDLPEAAQHVLLRCLAKQPGQRYASAHLFVDALDRCLQVPAPVAQQPQMAATLQVKGPIPTVEAPVPPRPAYIAPVRLPPPIAGAVVYPPARQRRGRGVFFWLVLLALVGGSLGGAYAYHDGYRLPAITLSGRNGSPVAGQTPGTTATTVAPTQTATLYSYGPVIPFCANQSGWQADSGTGPGNPDNGYQCTSSGLELLSSYQSQLFSTVAWQLPTARAAFTTQVAIHQLTEGCAGLGIQTTQTQYLATICDIGSWTLRQYDLQGNQLGTSLAHGTVNALGDHTIVLEANDATIKLTIDGIFQGSFHRKDSSNASVASIDLSYYDDIASSTCLLNDFSFQASAS